MPFELHFEDRDRAFLNGLSLSTQAKARLEDFIDYALAQVKDDFRKDPANRPDPSKPVFRCELFFVDAWGDERAHLVTFLVDDSRASYGVLLVVFVDHADGEWNWVEEG